MALLFPEKQPNHHWLGVLSTMAVKNSGGNQGFRAVSQWERFPFGLARLTRRGKETPGLVLSTYGVAFPRKATKPSLVVANGQDLRGD
jgi:hypothetical protein